jgi:hypothetical protein
MKYLILGLALLVLFAGCTQMNQQDDSDTEIIDTNSNTSLEQDVESLIIDENDSVDLGSII